MRCEYKHWLDSVQNDIFTQLSKWVIAVKKKKQSTKETLFDDDNVVDVSYIMKARSLREDLSSFDLVIIKNFFRFIVVISREIVDDEQKKIIVDSMNTFVE